jgi:dTDP-glucose 4,6-dehydratase
MDRSYPGIEGVSYMKKILVTGSCGFIFSNFMRKVMRDKLPYTFVSVDKVIAPYNRYNVELNRDHNFYMGDIADELFMDNVFSIEKPDIIIHGAAESFVDDSIRGAGPFIHSNVAGTQVMVDMSLKHEITRFVYVSTDEVYGQLKTTDDPSWTEETPINPRNPYSASKAAGELIVKAAHETHGLNYNITRCSNTYGGSQPPRNLVPKIISCLLKNQSIPIHGSGKQFREWIFVEDHCSAIMKIIEESPSNEIYNIGTGVELTNLEMVNRIAQVLGKDPQIKFVKDRPGHDFRYSINCSKIQKLGWKPVFSFDDGMKKCVQWYLDNPWYCAS